MFERCIRQQNILEHREVYRREAVERKSGYVDTEMRRFESEVEYRIPMDPRMKDVQTSFYKYISALGGAVSDSDDDYMPAHLTDSELDDPDLIVVDDFGNRNTLPTKKSIEMSVEDEDRKNKALELLKIQRQVYLKKVENDHVPDFHKRHGKTYVRWGCR